MLKSDFRSTKSEHPDFLQVFMSNFHALQKPEAHQGKVALQRGKDSPLLESKNYSKKILKKDLYKAHQLTKPFSAALNLLFKMYSSRIRTA